jgi:carboxynorspermidine decarboxylase
MLQKEILHDFPPSFLESVESPCYLISEEAVQRNCQLLQTVQEQTGVKILLALKAFALPSMFPVIREYLHGVCASGPIEAKLGRNDFGKEVHTYAPAFTSDQMKRTIPYSDFIIFNSSSQLDAHKTAISCSEKNIRLGMRVNPGYSEVKVDLYNPCLPGSRFGMSATNLLKMDLSIISGLHFHSMCEHGADVLFRTLQVFEENYGPFLAEMEWVNFGGGQHVTQPHYNINLLVATLNAFQERYPHLQVYMEPGEAVVLNAGVFVTTVLDLIHNETDIAILDCSAETHMPDVLAMPYRPHILGSGEPGEFPYTYRLGGISCLAGDVIGDYSFSQPLKPGTRLVLTDMALYSFVKNTSFNGVELPSIYSCNHTSGPKLIRKFGYEDYRGRLV